MSSGKKIVTVLMALYNGDKYLQESVQSVLDQTYGDFEFLIVNDASTDNSVKMVESFGDPRIRIITNEKNMGQTRSLNLGLRQAQGEYVARMDADDIALPTWLEEQVKFVKKNPQYSVVSAYGLIIDKNNRLNKTYNTPSDQDDIMLRAIISSPINHVASLIKVADVLPLDGYSEDYRIAADYDLWVKLLHRGCELTTNPLPLVAIRVHEDSISRVEKDTHNISEVATIIQKHILFMTGEMLARDQVGLLCDVNYNESKVDHGSFLAALAVLDRVCTGIQKGSIRDVGKIKRWRRAQRKMIIQKRIYAFIALKNYCEVRLSAKEGIRSFGWMSSFLLIYLAAFCGGILLNFIPLIYSLSRRIQALQMNKFQRQITVSNRHD